MLKAIVVGGAGALGKVLVNDLKKHGIKPLSIDFFENADAAENIVLRPNTSLKAQYQDISIEVKNRCRGNDIRGVFCTAGSWSGGDISDINFLDTIHEMNSANLYSAALAANLSCLHMGNGGIMILTGAEAALRPQPGMIGYGLSKLGTHYLTQSVSVDPNFVKKNGSSLAILPVAIDTPTNRKFMDNADFSSWTKPEEISELCVKYTVDPASRPASGTLISVFTKGGVTSWKFTSALCSASK